MNLGLRILDLEFRAQSFSFLCAYCHNSKNCNNTVFVFFLTRAHWNLKEYNALQFGGTIDLVQDIDLFRRAVGAPEMSILGFSYGSPLAFSGLSWQFVRMILLWILVERPVLFSVREVTLPIRHVQLTEGFLCCQEQERNDCQS